jgi:hypothetical protein
VHFGCHEKGLQTVEKPWHRLAFQGEIDAKIEWVMKTWNRVCFVGTVLGAWTGAGFIYEWNAGTSQKVRVNLTWLATKLIS